MTISELGSLGEVVGAFGLIVSLVFLAMEGTDKLTVQDLKIFCLSASISPPPFPKTQRHAA